MVMIPPKPRVIARDVRSFFARRERHNWAALLLAVAIPCGIIYLFVLDGNTNIFDDTPVVIYAESWPLDRSETEIRARQRELMLEADQQRALTRERFQQLADGFGIEYDREAAAEAERISEENRALAEELGVAEEGGPVEAGSAEDSAADR